MQLAIVINTNDAETMGNAFRLGAFSLSTGDIVSIFLMGHAVEIASITDPEFGVIEKAHAFIHEGGEILVCGTCLQRRTLGASDLYHVSDLKALHDLIERADKVVSF
jgi:sulfur relay (sulfurtransferase) complex TusBCD TusD component (DsrE family)